MWAGTKGLVARSIRRAEAERVEAAIAARNYDKCEVADIEEPWPVEPASFDGLHAGAILEHVVNWHAPLNSANRALRDDGLIVVSVPNLRYWKEVRKLIVGKQRQGPTGKVRCRTPGHENY